MSTSNPTQMLILNQENDQKKHLPEQIESVSAAGSVSQRDKNKRQEGLKI